MKTWPLLIGIIVILALVYSPVLAISKSDLISQYKIGYFPGPTGQIPTPTPTITPNPAPTQIPSKWPFPFVPDLYAKVKNSYLNSLAEDLHHQQYADDLPSKKPNIYLYSDRDIATQVRLVPECAITISEPVYQPGKGWQAEIRNGSLNGIGDFLFYEAMVPDNGWQKGEGYVIRAAYREQDMAFMLGQYNFNEKETLEFIEYWSQHLAEDVDFVFYPQETGAIDRVMPLYTTPKPDHVSRIWFYAEPMVSIPEPVTSPETIVREGFYIVEWGVMIR